MGYNINSHPLLLSYDIIYRDEKTEKKGIRDKWHRGRSSAYIGGVQKCNLNKMRDRERERRTRSDVTKLRKKSLINNKTISILQHV